MDLKAHIRQIPDFPKPGILFYDISTLLQAPAAWREAVDQLAARVAPYRPDRLVGIESRGFIVAAPLALQLGIGFGMVRKRGKLPGSVVSHAYSLEYGMDSIEISADLIQPGSRVVVIDDLIATGGTAAATVELLRKIGAEPVAAVFLIELTFLNGRAKLDVPVETLLAYDA
jgi:adenine phosphoribosyltransferase